MPQVSKLAIDSEGIITMIYADEHVDLLEQGIASVQRVSNVEPAVGGWFAMMNVGPALGPYRLRSEALAAEVAYLESKLF